MTMRFRALCAMALLGGLTLGATSCEKEKPRVEVKTGKAPEKKGNTEGSNAAKPGEQQKPGGDPPSGGGQNPPGGGGENPPNGGGQNPPNGGGQNPPGGGGENPDGKVWKVSARWASSDGRQYDELDIKNLIKTPESITLAMLKDLVTFSAKAGEETKEVPATHLRLEKFKYNLLLEKITMKLSYSGTATSDVELEFRVREWYERKVKVNGEFVKGIYLIAAYNYASNMMGDLFGFKEGDRIQYDRSKEIMKSLQWDDNKLSISFYIEDKDLDEVGHVQLTKVLSGFLPVGRLSKGLEIRADNEMIDFVKWYIKSKGNRIPSPEAMGNILQRAKREGRDLGNLMRGCDYKLDGKEMKPTEIGGSNTEFELTPETGLIAHLKRPTFKVKKVEKDVVAPGTLIVSLYLSTIKEDSSDLLHVSDGADDELIRLELPNILP